MKIFGWLADHAGCGWYRLGLPLGTLQEKGLAQLRLSGRAVDEDELGDVFVAQRTFMPGPTVRWQRMARKPNRPLMVYEIDDDLLNLSPDNPSSMTFNRPDVQRNIRSNAEVADLVTVSTEPLAEQMRKINPRVAVLPNCIPGDMLAWTHGSYVDRLTIGWQGSPTHDGDWSRANQAVATWFRANAQRFDAEMHTIGALPKSFPRLTRHRHTGWTPDIPRYYATVDWDIALAPLKNTVFNQSKSDIRILEAAMLGIPSIASDVPAYQTMPAGAGFLVTTSKQWRDALDALADDATRARASAQAHLFAETRTIDANAHLWATAYEKARSDSAI